MKLINPALAQCLVVFMASATAMAGDHRAPAHAPQPQTQPQPDSAGWLVVPVVTSPGDAAHGWRYFSQARDHRAVVISPTGEYFYSRGEGLRRVFKAGAAL
ncbi:hypothetical protein KAK06_19120 [Ideonella sp. 4Y11]|uniref:Uncharacterized protein n=1 Tax=Ideonella aquatica TaxID=2824119 RepID=A0A940YXM9_9BURK|nr:hypothetical protein [Ideonella aquatica]MBQ0961075.1 hypothetical protein [Ideonella aquatica]